MFVLNKFGFELLHSPGIQWVIKELKYRLTIFYPCIHITQARASKVLEYSVPNPFT